MKVRAYEAVGRVLQIAGVRDVFGLMGGGNLRWISQFESLDVGFWGARHEACGMAMAVGYAQATNGIGVATVTQGPGLTNALTAVRGAVMSRIPLVVLAGDTPRGSRHNSQQIDQDAVFSAAGAQVEPVPRAQSLPDALGRALQRAQIERVPVGISVPSNLQDIRIEFDGWSMPPIEHPSPAAPRPSEVNRIVQRLNSAQRPVILGGRGAFNAAAEPLLGVLADRTGAFLATTLLAKGMFDSHPHNIGICGGFSAPGAMQLIEQSDLVVAFGASLNQWTTNHGHLLALPARVVRCDAAPLQNEPYVSVDLTVEADAALLASALLNHPDLESRDLRGLNLASKAAAARERVFDDLSTDGLVDPRSLFERLDQLLPPNRALALDVGHFFGWPSMHTSVSGPANFLPAVHFGAIGLGLGTALGAAIARTEQLVVAVVGDGGLMLTLGELETAVRYDIPVAIVVVNDGAYGAEIHHCDLLGLPNDQAYFGDVDFATVSRALGGKGVTVRHLDELEQIRPWLSEPSGPLVIDCKVPADLRAAWMDSLHRSEPAAGGKSE